MTGKELLFEELRNRGLTEAQINSRGVAVVLDVLANDGRDRYLKAKELDDEIRQKEQALNDLKKNYQSERFAIEHALRCVRERRSNIEENIREMKEEFSEYMDSFGEALTSLETPEARDRLKTAQLFANSVKIQSKENNTAYIQGLAQILCGLTLKAGLPNGLKPMTRLEFDPDAKRPLPDDLPTIQQR